MGAWVLLAAAAEVAGLLSGSFSSAAQAKVDTAKVVGARRDPRVRRATKGGYVFDGEGN